jgi:putative peptidoglycan lipid II flippase
VSKQLKNISVVATATMASRVLGLVRDSLTAAVFGTSALASAFFTAFQLPNLFRRLLGEGALTAAFVPTLNDALARERREGAFTLVSQVASWLLLVSGALVLAAMALLSWRGGIVRLGEVGGAEPDTVERWLLSAELAVVLFPYLVFVCMAAAFSAALQTLGRFLEPALSPIWLNLAMIGLLGGAFVYWPGNDIRQMHGLCAGVLLGGFLQMIVPAWALYREGWRPRLDLRRSEPMRAIVRLMVPTVLGSAVYLVNMTVSRLIGLSLNDAAVSVLNFAQRLMELPIGVFAVAVSTVIFPLISRYAAEGDHAKMSDAYRKGMRLILVINIPAAVGLALLAEPIVRVIFQRGAFSPGDTHAMLPVLAAYALGLPFLSFVSLVLRAFYAQKDTVTPVRAALLSFVVNLGLSFALMGRFGTLGLAIAGNVAVVAQAGFLQLRLARNRPDFAFRHLTRDMARILGASVAMGLAVAAGWWAWSRHFSAPTTGSDAMALLVMIAGGVLIYGAVVWALRIDGREELAAMLLRRFRRPDTAARSARN